MLNELENDAPGRRFFFSRRRKKQKSKIILEELQEVKKNMSKQPSKPDNSTSAIINTIIPVTVPILRKAISKKLIDEGLILFHEEPVKEYDEKALPIGEISIQIDQVLVMDRRTIQKDMEAAPKFQWPSIQNLGSTMVVLDFVGFDCLIPLGEGIELTFLAELPLGMTGHIEIGYGGEVEIPSIRLQVPRLRLWFDTKTYVLNVAFLDRPTLTPFLNVNLDRGNGDFFDMTITEEGSLDDIVESVLSNFGPKAFTKPKKKSKDKQAKDAATLNKENANNNKGKDSWLGIAIGYAIAKAVQKSLVGNQKNPKGGNLPIRLDLSEQIEAALDSAMGKAKHRPVEVIQADISTLQQELRQAKRLQKQGKHRSALFNCGVSGGDDDAGGGYLFCCGGF